LLKSIAAAQGEKKMGNASYSREVEVVNVLGIHARPSTMIVNLAKALKMEKVYIKNLSDPDQEIDPGSIMSLTMMAAEEGARLIVYTENENMHGAVDALVDLIKSGFGEEIRKK
jgi:phosphocarrier protein HPr